MVLILSIILVLGQIVSISCGTLQSSNKGERRIGESLKLEWKLNFAIGEKESESSLSICPNTSYSKCFASGIEGTFNSAASTVFGNRLETKSLGNGIYSMTINNLNKTDDGLKLYVRAIFRKSAILTTNVAYENITIHVKAYPKVLKSLESPLYFNEDDTPTVEINASGIPRPTVTWKFHNFASSEGNYTNKGNDQYSYNYTLPKLERTSCGSNLDYTISGWNNSVITKSSTVIVKFTPDKPDVTDVTVSKRNENMITATWKPVDYGQCSVNFTAEVLDKSSKVMKSIHTEKLSVDITFNSKEERGNATILQVISSFHGKQNKSSQMNITFVPTEAPTTTKKGGGSGSNGSNSNIALIIGVVAGVIVVIIIIVVIVIYLKKENEKKLHSTVGSTQGGDNSYNHIPLDNRDGAQENNYTSVPSSKPSSKPSSRADDPDQMLYAELGAGGGRTGPKPAPEQSNYAVVKVDEMGYPARGPTSDKKSQPTYAAVNRDKSRRHSPPPPDDDNEGVIV